MKIKFLNLSLLNENRTREHFIEKINQFLNLFQNKNQSLFIRFTDHENALELNPNFSGANLTPQGIYAFILHPNIIKLLGKQLRVNKEEGRLSDWANQSKFMTILSLKEKDGIITFDKNNPSYSKEGSYLFPQTQTKLIQSISRGTTDPKQMRQQFLSKGIKGIITNDNQSTPFVGGMRFEAVFFDPSVLQIEHQGPNIFAQMSQFLNQMRNKNPN